ncbi:MAG: hypothetical protein Sv326_0046 [Candidatus Fermentimicrarchaeum limneticum]|uniref:Uncharacterized protein n=1 Tax=Fermentimicrarchaeum limneticum TaxID=2795018 RepID=A0A7D6BSD1_FERL1|nr:MAG: hypothetical protein Sv326_0046 [Candidatus Fermentimicrarchaeum limneticum]
MISDEAIHSIQKRKLRRLIGEVDFLISMRRPSTLSEAHEISEMRLEKIKFQLELNSLMLQDADGTDERKELEEERNKLQESFAAELRNGVEIIDTLVDNLRDIGMYDKAEELEILRDVRESELGEVNAP